MEINKQRFQEIKRFYEKQDQLLLKKQIMLGFDTGIGFWAPTDLDDLVILFKKLFSKKEHQNFCDLGSGDGRVCLVASLFGFKNIIGIEQDMDLHKKGLEAKKLLPKNNHTEVKLLKTDFTKLDDSKKFDKQGYFFIAPDKPFFRDLESSIKYDLKGTLIVNSFEFLPEKLDKIEELITGTSKFSIFRI